jgi:hypothetical protein
LTPWCSSNGLRSTEPPDRRWYVFLHIFSWRTAMAHGSHRPGRLDYGFKSRPERRRHRMLLHSRTPFRRSPLR